MGRDVISIVLITVALGEVGLRIIILDPLPIFYSGNPDRFRGKPFAPFWNFHLNSRGFNDVEFSAHKTPGTIRILGIGDSFAFGVVPYEYNYLTLVEQYLKQSGHNVELINMGIPSIGPKEYLSLLVDRGFALEPDRVLLSFSISSAFGSRGKRRTPRATCTWASLVHVCMRDVQEIERTNRCRDVWIMRLHSPTMPIWRLG